METCLNDFKTLQKQDRDTSMQLHNCQVWKELKEANEKYEKKSLDYEYNDRIKVLEKDKEACHTEKKSLNDKFAKCENDCVSFQKDLKNSETKKSDTFVLLTECKAWREANEPKGYDTEKIIKLEKDNVTSHTENKYSKENFAKCEKDHISCQKEKEKLSEDVTAIHVEYAKCDI